MMNEKIKEDFISIVGAKNIITKSKHLEKYNRDWRGFYNNKSLGILFPKNLQILKKSQNIVLKKILKLYLKEEIQV